MALTTQFPPAESTPLEKLAVETVTRYFETIGAGDFQATANLFADAGILNAPFEEPIVGRTAIASYLEAEAQGMQLYPQQARSEALENGTLQIQIVGKVQTPIFSVNVGWLFLLNAEKEIVSVTVKLLASPQELLSLRPATKF